MSKAGRFTQDDIKRVIKGAIAAGLQVGSVRVAPTGEIVVCAAGEDQDQANRPNPLDRILKHGS